MKLQHLAKNRLKFHRVKANKIKPFSKTANRNEYTTKQVQSASVQLKYVLTLYLVKLHSIKTADRLLQCILLNRLFQTFAESRSVYVFVFVR